MFSEFLKSDSGQKLLLFFAPFFLSPQEIQGKTPQSALFKHFYLSTFSPAIGAVFLTGALASFYRLFHAKGYSFSWLIQFSPVHFIFILASLLMWLAYTSAFARFAAGQMLAFFQPYEEHQLNWPLSFWLTYYGGIFIVTGAFIWLLSGFLMLHFSFWMGSISFIVIVLLGLYLRFEIKFLQEKRKHRVHYKNWYKFNILTLGLFLVMQGVGLVLIFIYYIKSSSS